MVLLKVFVRADIREISYSGLTITARSQKIKFAEIQNLLTTHRIRLKESKTNF